MFRKIIIIVVLCMTTCTIFAQDVVSLVVSGEGKDKNEATQNALRSAIEQTFGTFVSANTTILNDQLVADLISNNIKKYNYITENRHPDGNYYVTLSVDVALKQMVSYAKSNGSECELAGATNIFGAKVKKYRLYLESSRKVLNNLRLQCIELAPFLYDYQLEVGEPQIDGTVEFTVKVLANENTKNFGDLIVSTLEALEFDSNYAKQLEAMGVKTEAVSFHTNKDFYKKYKLWDSINKCNNRIDNQVYERTLHFERKLGTGKYLPDELFHACGSFDYYDCRDGTIIVNHGDFNAETFRVYDDPDIDPLRSDTNNFLAIMSRLQVLSYGNFMIRDNLLKEYSITDDDMYIIEDYYYYGPLEYIGHSSHYDEEFIRKILFGLGYVSSYKNKYHYSRGNIFKFDMVFGYPHDGKGYSHVVIDSDYEKEKGEQCFEVHFKMKIPLETLMNITKFTVERKNDKF